MFHLLQLHSQNLQIHQVMMCFRCEKYDHMHPLLRLTKRCYCPPLIRFHPGLMTDFLSNYVELLYTPTSFELLLHDKCLKIMDYSLVKRLEIRRRVRSQKYFEVQKRWHIIVSSIIVNEK